MTISSEWKGNLNISKKILQIILMHTKAHSLGTRTIQSVKCIQANALKRSFWNDLFFLPVLFSGEQTENYVMKTQNWKKSQVRRNRQKAKCAQMGPEECVHISDRQDDSDNHNS